MLDVFTKVVLAGACLFTFAWVVLTQRRTVRRLSDAYLRLTHFQRVLVALAVVICTVYAQKPYTNDVNGVSGTNLVGAILMRSARGNPACPTVPAPEDIARCWQLVEVRTNAAADYAMPEGAVLASNWWVRGAYEDVVRMGIGDWGLGSEWKFPFGSNEYDSLWAFTWGKVRFSLADTNTEIVAVGAPMSAVPHRSRLWSAADTNGAKVVTWENFVLGRDRLPAPRSEDAAGTVNAQVELRRNGDFVTRSNEVEKVYRRVDPEDWDGDGWRNDDDPDPYVWEEYWDGFWQELPDGANESAYCWIEIRPRWNSYIEFVGDGPSDLDDPYLWAKAGETYRVQLLIGKTYFIESTQPLDVEGRSDSSIEVDGNGTCELEVVWPVTMSALESNGMGFRMVVRPSGLGGLFHWPDSCCTLYGSGLVCRYGCDGVCGCSGCYAQGHYEYEGYRLSATGGWCGCSPDHGVDHDPQSDPHSVGASISFTKQAILFEDEYANTTNDIVPWHSTETELVCSAYGGGNGGFVRFDISGDDGLVQYTGHSLPYVRNLAPNERICFTNRYRAVSASLRKDEIEAASYFSENVTGWTERGETYATAIRVEIRVITEAPENKCPNRHILGVGEAVNCDFHPGDVGLAWTLRAGNWNSNGEYCCPLLASIDPVSAVFKGVLYVPHIMVLEPNGIVTRNPRPVTFGVSPGRAGWVGLRQEYYVLPLDVSFSGVDMEEVPCSVGARSGYFNRPEFDIIGCHSRGMSAGRWLSVTEGNKMGMYDTAAITVELMRVNSNGEFTEDTNCCWSTGWVTWEVPFGWAAKGAAGSEREVDPVGQFDPGAGHRFEITPDGDVTVRKFGNSAERLITGVLKLNGELWSAH